MKALSENGVIGKNPEMVGYAMDVDEKAESNIIDWEKACPKGTKANCLIKMVEKNSDYAVSVVENGRFKPDREALAKLVAYSGFDHETKQLIFDGINGKRCKGIWGKITCLFKDKLIQQELHNENFDAEIYNVIDRNSKVSKKIDTCLEGDKCVKEEVICEEGMSASNCRESIEIKLCPPTKSKDVCDKANRILDENRKLDPTKLVQYNKDVIKANIKAGGVTCEYEEDKDCERVAKACSGDPISSGCRDAMTSYCEVMAKKRKGKIDCSKIIGGLEKAKKDQFVETNVGFTILDAILNPDQSAMDTVRLIGGIFGYEADYTWLPNWLKEDVSSSICLAKIDGYLDEAVSDGRGGLTQYERELETEPRTGQPFDSNVVVRADLRGQRSRILPDDSVNIMYSYYLRAPDDKDLLYNLRLGYIKDGNKVIKDLFSEPRIRNLSKGQTVSDFQSIKLPPINDSEDVDPNSFSLNFRAKHNDNKIVDLIAPMVLIESGNTISGRARISSGGSGVSNQENAYSDFWDD